MDNNSADTARLLEQARAGDQAALNELFVRHRARLRRDIKPSNLLLDMQGTVWVTDFGLAKAEDQQNLTHTGDILGTLRYMPPEAFEGRTDARSDVYSLGLTLYEMLAFRPAFDEKDRNRLIKQVTNEDPERLGKWNPLVPRDLLTIVHKSIDRDPAHRFQSAAEMAADLQRFIDDEPIQARRVTWLEKGWRWCRHNRVVASLVALLLLLLLGGTIASTVAAGYFSRLAATERDFRLAEEQAKKRETDLRSQAEDNLREAKNERARAEQNFEKARAAVDNYLTQVSENQLLRVPGMQPLRRQLLDSALSFYQDFVRERRGDSVLQSELAAVYLRIARIQSELGNEVEKRKAAREAVQLYQALVSKAPKDEAAQAHLIEAYARSDQAAKAVAVGETFEAAHPDCLQIKEQLANAHNALGLIQSQRADWAGTMRAYENSLRLRQQLCQRNPANAEYELGLAIALNNIGALLDRFGRKADALVSWRHSLDHARNLFARSSRDFSVIRLLYRGLNNSSVAEEDLGLFEAALKTNREGLELTQKLMKSDPDVPEHVYFCYAFAVARARWLETRGRNAEARSAYRIAVENSASPLLHAFALVNSATWVQFAIDAIRGAELIAKEAKDMRPQDRAEQDRFAELALQHLKRGLDSGYKNPRFLRSGKQLDFLRSRADFQELLKRAEKDSAPLKEESQVAKASNVEHPKVEPLVPNKPTTSWLFA